MSFAVYFLGKTRHGRPKTAIIAVIKISIITDNNEIILFDKLLGSYEVLFVICAFIIAISMNAFILIREEGAMGVRTFLRQLIFYRKQIP